MKVIISDFIDILLSLLRFNKKKFYREFIIQSSISQLIRGKTHNKRNILNYAKRLAKYLYLILRIISFYYKFTLIKDNNKNKAKDFDLLIIYPNKDNWILKGLSKDFEKEIRKLAARSRTRRKGGRLLYSQDRDLPALGVGTTLTDVASVRDPMKDERMMT